MKFPMRGRLPTEFGSKTKAVIGRIKPTPNSSRIVAQIMRKKRRKKNFFCFLDSMKAKLLSIDIYLI